MIVQELFTNENILLILLSSIGSNFLLKDITLELTNINLLILIISHILLFNYFEIKLSHKCNKLYKEENKYGISALSINIILIIYIFVLILLIYVWIKYISELELIKNNNYNSYLPIGYFVLIQWIYYLLINKLIFNFKC